MRGARKEGRGHKSQLHGLLHRAGWVGGGGAAAQQLAAPAAGGGCASAPLQVPALLHCTCPQPQPTTPCPCLPPLLPRSLVRGSILGCIGVCLITFFFGLCGILTAWGGLLEAYPKLSDGTTKGAGNL